MQGASRDFIDHNDKQHKNGIYDSMKWRQSRLKPSSLQYGRMFVLQCEAAQDSTMSAMSNGSGCVVPIFNNIRLRL